MEVLFPRCAGLDVHRDSVVACVRIAENGAVLQEVRTFGATTKELLGLSEWLTEHGVTHAAMEATGVYWKPVWHVLDGSVDLVLANASHIKNVPGRKTDVNDATWISDLLAHGLIRASFVPPTPVQELRGLTRTRKQLVRERASHVQRVDKILQDANLKMGSVLTDIMGMSGRAVLAAILAGESDPEKLVAHVGKRVKTSRAKLVEALRGKVTPHHRFLLGLHLAQADALEAAINTVDKEVGERIEPFRVAANRLAQIPGLSEVAAAAVVSEIGIEMARFPTSGHLISWAGLCPKNDESAGKRRSNRLRNGAPWLKTLLVQCAWCATRANGTYFQAQYRRLAPRRGAKKAIMAVAASILTSIYVMLRRGVDFVDLGADHFVKKERSKTANRLIRRLGELGYEVTGIRDNQAA